MPRILAFDYGAKRTGLAVTDPLQLISGGLCTLPTKELFDFLKDYMQKEEVERFVVGEPLGLNGKDTDASPLVRSFVKKLKKTFPEVPISMIDERYTSIEAQRVLILTGVRKKKRRDKSLLDKVSATIILQQYMESI